MGDDWGREGSKIQTKHQIPSTFDDFISLQQPPNSLTDGELRGGNSNGNSAWVIKTHNKYQKGLEPARLDIAPGVLVVIKK